jgi:hypothetical protein
VWQTYGRARWKSPPSVLMNMDVINGRETNDGLATGSGGAVRSFAVCIRYLIKDCFDLTGASSIPFANIIVQLADNASGGTTATPYTLAHLAFPPVGAEGRCGILVQGNAVTPSNVVIADSGGVNIGCYGPINVQVRNLQVGQTSAAATPLANGGIDAGDGANIRLEGGVIFGSVSAAQVSSSNGGSVTFDGPFSIVGGGANFAMSNGGRVSTGGQACTISNTPAYTQQFCTCFEQGQIVAAGQYRPALRRARSSSPAICR